REHILSYCSERLLADGYVGLKPERCKLSRQSLCDLRFVSVSALTAADEYASGRHRLVTQGRCCLTTPHKLRPEARDRNPMPRRQAVCGWPPTDGRGRQLHAVVRLRGHIHIVSARP